jgi:hypothetical protein
MQQCRIGLHHARHFQSVAGLDGRKEVYLAHENLRFTPCALTVRAFSGQLETWRSFRLAEAAVMTA